MAIVVLAVPAALPAADRCRVAGVVPEGLHLNRAAACRLVRQGGGRGSIMLRFGPAERVEARPAGSAEPIAIEVFDRALAPADLIALGRAMSGIGREHRILTWFRHRPAKRPAMRWG